MKKLFALVIVLVVAGVSTLWWLRNQQYTVVLTEDQILAKLNEKFPFEKTYLFLITLRFEHPQVTLEEGSDRIRFGCDLTLNVPIETGENVPSGPIHGTAIASGSIRYEPDDGTFFLDEPRFETLSVDRVPDKWMKKIRSSAEKAASEFLKKAPIYRLKSGDVAQAAARLVLQGVVVRNKQLVITLGVD